MNKLTLNEPAINHIFRSKYNFVFSIQVFRPGAAIATHLLKEARIRGEYFATRHFGTKESCLVPLSRNLSGLNLVINCGNVDVRWPIWLCTKEIFLILHLENSSVYLWSLQELIHCFFSSTIRQVWKWCFTDISELKYLRNKWPPYFCTKHTYLNQMQFQTPDSVNIKCFLTLNWIFPHSHFLDCLLQRYIPNFETEKIGMIELPYLNEERLMKIGIPMGPRLRILQESQMCFRQENFDIYIV